MRAAGWISQGEAEEGMGGDGVERSSVVEGVRRLRGDVLFRRGSSCRGLVEGC